VSGDTGAYLAAASADADEPAAIAEWTIRIHKHRCFIDNLTGANRMAADDPLAALVERTP
jgi:hypothetical protein